MLALRGLHFRVADRVARSVAAVALAFLSMTPLDATAADQSTELDPAELKISLTHYQLQDAPHGQDLNLRWRRSDTTLWFGTYRDTRMGEQSRAGWEDRWPVLSTTSSGPVAVLSSVQVAAGGFAGGSVSLQVGQTWWAQAGIGRTNLRPYVNLNFDPNDALMFSAGWQIDELRQISASLIADDRLGTGQRHAHLNMRWPLHVPWSAQASRITLDVLRKTGQGDSGLVREWGWSATLDQGPWFGRIARDPKQNFSAVDAWRFTLGRRF